MFELKLLAASLVAGCTALFLALGFYVNTVSPRSDTATLVYVICAWAGLIAVVSRTMNLASLEAELRIWYRNQSILFIASLLVAMCAGRIVAIFSWNLPGMN